MARKKVMETKVEKLVYLFQTDDIGLLLSFGERCK